MLNDTDFDSHEETDNHRIAKEWKYVIDNPNNGVVKVGLYGFDHGKAFPVETFLPEEV